MQTLTLRFVFSFLLLGLFCAGARAQPASGSITGRVFNAATKEYVRNAEVRVEGTKLAVLTEDAGFYRIAGVAPGDVTLSVTYTGAQPTSATLRVSAGQAA